jgi:chromatin remodeling complex protein RSC6
MAPASAASTASAAAPSVAAAAPKSAPAPKAPKVAPAPAASASSSPAPGASAAPVKVKQPKQPKEVVAAVAVVASDVNVATPVGASSSAETSLFAASHTKLQTLVSALASLRSELRGIERQVERELRAARKASDKKRRKNVNRQPSGFVKPTLISNELATFLGKAIGSEMARTEVTREINAYIRDKSLQDKENGRRILPDAKLKKLLKLKDEDELTYFNLQRFMSPHFSTAAKLAAAAAIKA